MVNVVVQVVGVITIAFLGYLVVNLLVSEMFVLEKFSVGFLIGLGLLTFTLFLGSWFFSMPFEQLSVGAVLFWLILLFAFLNFLAGKRTIQRFNFVQLLKLIWKWYKNLSKFEKLLIWCLGFIFVSILIADLYWPVWMWDAVSLYDYRAKQMVLLGKIVGSFAVSGGTYPLLTSVSHAVIYVFGGANPKYLYFLFFLSLSIVFYSFLRRYLRRSYSLVSLIFLITVPLLLNQSQVTLTDLPQSAFLASGFLYLIFGLDSDNKSYVVLSGTLLSLSSWIRNEPFWFVGLFVMIVCSLRKKWFTLDIIFASIVYSVGYIWDYFLKHFSHAGGGEQTLTNAATRYAAVITRSEFWIRLSSFVFRNIFLPVWPAFLALFFLLIVRRKNLSNVVRLMTFMIVVNIVFLCAGVGVYITGYDFWTALYTSLQRILIFLDVLVVADLALLLFPNLIGRKTG